MLGGRCNSKEITHDVTRLGERRRARTSTRARCTSSSTNFLGLNQLPLDRGPHGELRGVEPAGRRLRGDEAGQGRGDRRRTSASARPATRGRTTPNAKELYEVTHDGHATSSRAARARADRLREQHLDRRLPLHPRGRQRPARSSAAATAPTATNTHIDFLWSPTGHVRAEQPERRRREGQAAHQASVAPQ